MWTKSGVKGGSERKIVGEKVNKEQEQRKECLEGLRDEEDREPEENFGSVRFCKPQV